MYQVHLLTLGIFNTDTIPNETPVLVEDSERGEILAWISPVNVIAKHFDVFRTLQRGTGQWLLDDPAFQAWINGSREALWLVGIPGAGKTVLASLVIEHLRTTQREWPTVHSIGVAWVYYNYKEASTQTPDAVLLSIARQLAGSSTDIYTEFKSAYKRDPYNRPFPEQLVSSGLLMRGFKKVFFVIDALDECAPENRDAFLKMMGSLQASGANILITSRDHVSDYVTSGVVAIRRIDIKNTEDIASYIQTCLEKQTHLTAIVRSKPGLSQKIVTAIVKSSEGMFLLATLQIQSLRKCTTVGSLGDALNVLPTTIAGIYDAAMHRIESDDRSEDALRVLSYLVHARRPLKLEELQHFLTVQPGHMRLDDIEDYIMHRDTLISLCTGLVVVEDKTNIIRLVHYTAQEYFDKRWEVFPQGDEEMGRKCLTYLSFEDWKPTSAVIHPSRKFYSPSLFEYWPIFHRGLRDYVVHHWHLHVVNHQWALREFLCAFLKNDQSIRGYHQYLSRGPLKDLIDPKGIHVAAASGLLLAVEWLIPDNQMNLGTALVSASEGGHEAVVTMLLDHGADVDALDGERNTALMQALQRGHTAVVKLLLKCGAKTEAHTKFDGSALHLALQGGRTTMVKLLLEHGADIEARDKDGYTALIVASLRQERAVVKLLLEHGADIEARDKDGCTALIVASLHGHWWVAKLLLEHTGADIEARDKDGCTALIVASLRQKRAVVNLLLEHGADIEARDKDGCTALIRASLQGNCEEVELLLERGADVQAHTQSYGTALMQASGGGHDTVVRLLLEHGADIEAQDKDKCTALITATIHRRHGVVKLLLEHGHFG
ncbi:ankyrin repeat-containing domain protein, partial [Mycena latifolia]